MVVPWTEIPAPERAKVGKPIAAHEFCKRLPCFHDCPGSTGMPDDSIAGVAGCGMARG